MGESYTLTCNDTEAEIDDTLTNEVTLKCGENGTFTPDTIGTCAVPANCSDIPDADNAVTGLVYSGGSDPIKAYRYATFSCNESSLITDEGKTLQLFCQADGTFETRTWPVCRYPHKCIDFVPLPPLESGLADSSTEVNFEAEEAIYACLEAPAYLVNGVDADFRLTCSINGTFPNPVNWPKCIDPSTTTTTTTTEKPLEPCQCIGDLSTSVAKRILDEFCRDPEIPGNVFNYGGYTPSSRKRCGTRSPSNPTLQDHCFCSTVEEQARKLFSLFLTSTYTFYLKQSEEDFSSCIRKETFSFINGPASSFELFMVKSCAE